MDGHNKEENMITEIRMALKYSDTLPEAVKLIEHIQGSIRDDGTMSRESRSQLMSEFWKLVKIVRLASS